ncbi:peptide MFS transporter [Cysteiniphilum sp. QT6929]|uniref:peptide MFS transporter n=1 Tax=Cysteiniphilum sp. QT6929 TaxID=2975055 RepID=UPI0024B337E9|nr:peptide MFS transporter [Cysteiniphilum sp. QT6929]WHN66289.1 peptide MFS transporter [Cysteiniphilum sp. QT6929]
MKVLKGQGSVLTIASLTEFGERYSYYVIQSLLIFFLIHKFNLPEAKGASLVGTVLSMVYISALVGGYIADKLISYYRAATLGVAFMIAGSLVLAVASSENLLFLGLSFISISTGLIKSNISSFIGRFYDKTNATEGQRDFGFNIFYVGINLGGFAALFVASYLSETYGFAAPFYSSLIVSILVLINLIVGFFILAKHIKEVKINLAIVAKTILILAVYFVVVFLVLKNPIIANVAITVAGLGCFIVMLVSAQKKYWRNVIVAFIFFALSILYWALFFQIFISVLLFISKGVNNNLLGWHILDSQFLSFESVGVLIFGFFMGKLWLSLERKGKSVQDIDKFNIGFILLAVVFLIIWIGIQLTPKGQGVPAIYMIVAFLIMAISELSLSAIGLSLITKLAPPNYVSLYMGIWLVTLGIGGKLAGVIAQWAPVTGDIHSIKTGMSEGLQLFIVLTIVGALLCLVLRRFVIAKR